MNYHVGPRYQRGRGLGSIFGALFRGLAPIAKLGLRAGKSFIANPAIRQFGQSALNMAKESAKNIALDVLEGRNVKDSAQEELNKARSKIASTLRGGRKRKNHHKKPYGPIKKRKLTYNLLD